MPDFSNLTANWRAYLIELVGTFVVVLLTAGAVCANSIPALAGQAGYGRIGIALVAGLSWAIGLALTLRLSGGFLNPALTVTMWVFQRIDNKKAVGLIVSQFLGAAFAGLAIRGLFIPSERAMYDSRLGTPHLNMKVFDAVDRNSMLTGIGVEAVLTFVLTFGVFALLYDPRIRRKVGEKVHALSYFWLGLLLMVLVMVGFEVTGGSMNPARWAGTALWETTVDGLAVRGPFADHGPYWIGPILGSLLAGMLYTYAILPEGTPKGPPGEGMP